jgi:hypothetical protein
MLKHWPQGLHALASQIGWYPSFQPWGRQYKAIKFSISLVTWGSTLKIIFFLFQPWLLVCKSPWCWFSTFAPIGMLWFELNIRLDSLYESGGALDDLRNGDYCGSFVTTLRQTSGYPWRSDTIRPCLPFFFPFTWMVSRLPYILKP